MKESEKHGKRAIALQYEPGKGKVPVITAVGKGSVAEKIMQEAKKNNVPIYEDDFQAQTLSTLDIGTKIPKILFDLVAEILVFVEEIDERKKEGTI